MQNSLLFSHFNDKENHYQTTNSIRDHFRNQQHKLNTNHQHIIKESLMTHHQERQNAFKREDMKDKSINSQFLKEYGCSILDKAQNKQTLGDFLLNHEIDAHLRAKMLDWMIQVASTYKFNHHSYFYSTLLMDRYFQKEKQSLTTSKLHKIGVVALHIASKMNEVYPLKIKTVYQKIGHRKLSISELIETQNTIMERLDYNVSAWTFYDYAMFKLTELQEFWLQSRFHDTSSLKSELSKCKMQEKFKIMEQICSYVCMHVVFQYELYSQSCLQLLAEGCLKVVLEMMKFDEVPELFFTSSLFLLQKMKNGILNSMKCFKQNNQGLSNIFKYNDERVMAKVASFSN